jgi:hypothetical protein
MSLPRLLSADKTGTPLGDGITLAVYAPFGTDRVLSTYPDGTSLGVLHHPLVQALRRVAEHGTHVVALVDLVDDDTYLVEIPAHRAGQLQVTSRWKQDMESPQTLTGLLRHAHQRHPGSAMVLAMEGHGAGFLPDLDTTQLTIANVTGKGAIEWHVGSPVTVPTFADGKPVLAQGAPILPRPSPTSPTNHAALSTFGLGAALKAAEEAGVPKLAAIHFNNCFNMSVEVLHTVAPYAEFATGYENYEFFTAGEAYPAVFKKVAAAGSPTTQQLALWFATGNHELLKAKGHHPTVGGVVQLSRLHSITECIDDLSDALLAALRSTEGTQRAQYVAQIRKAIQDAQQLDSDGNFVLDTPDELTDLRSLAHELATQAFDFGPFKVQQTAAALVEVLDKIKVYGDDTSPWMAPNATFDFSSPFLAMNIFLPDPLRIGKWDWRSPYYLDVNPDPSKPQVQRNIIDFVKVTDWVDFLIEYHKDVPFVGLLPAQLPEFLHFNQGFKPPRRRKPTPPTGERAC